VVIKPSELTPFTGELFMDLVEEAGFRPGVVNLLPGTADAGHRLVTHPLGGRASLRASAVVRVRLAGLLMRKSHYPEKFLYV
jgi:aldehyde dehydrogenase (NAD+)